MLYDKNKLRATPKSRSEDYDGTELIAKCGEINVWHWARRVADPDSFSDGETEWHLRWKLVVPKERTEVVMKKDGVCHRADIVTSDGIVIELQASPISTDQIRAREAFYERMKWLFDCREPYENGRLDIRSCGDYATFRWKHARKSIAFCSPGTAHLDLGEQIFQIKEMYDDSADGLGYLRTSDKFTKRLQR